MADRPNLAWIGIWAVGTIGVAALLWGPMSSRAQEGAEIEQPAEPVLIQDGVRLRIALAPEAPLELNQPPRLVLTATNPTAEDITTRVRVQLTSQQPSSAWSRVASFPEPFHTTDVQIAVKAAGSTTVAIVSDQPAPAGVITARLLEATDAAASDDQPASKLTMLAAGVTFPLGSTVPDATAEVAQAAR